jgi:hypothetical protein
MITGDNDTDDKFFTAINNMGEQLSPVTTALASDNDTADMFFTGINDTGEQLSPVTTTPAITFFPGVVDTGHK